MKCSNVKCGIVGTGKFCHECGGSMVEEQTTGTVVICYFCGAELTKKDKFCSQCGKKVDPSLFNVVTCSCGAPLKPTDLFCTECGEGRIKSTGVSSKATEPCPDVSNVACSETAATHAVEVEHPEPKEHTNTSVATKDNADQMRQITTVSSTTVVNDSNILDSDSTNKQDKDIQSESGSSFNTYANNPQSQYEGHPNHFQSGKLHILDSDDTPVDDKVPASGETNENAELDDTALNSSHRSTYEEDKDNVTVNESQLSETSGVNTDTFISSPGSTLVDSNDIVTRKGQTPNEEPDHKCKSGSLDKLTPYQESTFEEDKENVTDNESPLSETSGVNAATFLSNPGSTLGGSNDIVTKKGQTPNEEPDHTCRSSSGSLDKLTPYQESTFEEDKENATENAKRNSDKSDSIVDNFTKGPGNDRKNCKESNGDADQADSECNNEGTDVDECTERALTGSIHQANESKKNKNIQNNQFTKPSEKHKGPGMKRPSEQCIRVEFHVITSADFKFNPSTHDCYIVFGDKDLDGWNNRAHTLIVQRLLNEHDEHVYHLWYKRYIPTRLICRGQRTPYKYLIKTKQSGHETWEHYTNVQRHGAKNRHLSVQMNQKAIDEWKQFDYFLEREPEGFTAKVLDFFKWKQVLMEHITFSLDYFCPDISDGTKTFLPVESIRKKFQNLIDCASNIYFHDAKCWTDYNHFMKWISKTLLTTMVVKWNLDSTNLQHPIAALLCLYVVYVGSLDMPDKKTSIVLCKNLIIQTDTERQECPDLIHAVNIFPGTELLEAVLHFVKTIMKNTKKPCWLALMPWIHFLSGESTPFETTSEDAMHDKKDPTWWGISRIKSEVETFKRNSKSWKIHMEELLKHVSPLFKVDYLLPRSFIAAVEPRDLLQLIQSQEIPIYICLAHLTYRMKTLPTPYYYDSYRRAYYYRTQVPEEELIVQDCVQAVLAQLQETFYSEDRDITEWNLCYVIASDLFHASVSKQTRSCTVYSVQVFVHCVAMYDKILVTHKDRTSSKDNICSHTEILTSCASRTVEWLNMFSRWDKGIMSFLDIWDNCFASIALPSETVMHQWNNILSEALLQGLKREVCRQSSLMRQFVNLYCENSDKYNPCMQACMGTAAFFAIDQGYALDFTHCTQDNSRFTSLLSKMFITEWTKNVKIGTNAEDDTMLTHVLRWPPLSHYLKRYVKDKNKIECVDELQQAVSIIDRRMRDLLTGDLTVGDLQQIYEKGGQFPELAALAQTEVTALFVQKTLTARQKELEAFQSQAKQMSVLVLICGHLASVNTSSVDQVLDKYRTKETHKIRDLWKPADVDEVPDIEKYAPSACSFPVSDDVLNIVPTLCVCFESSTFETFWIKQCKELRNECPELTDVVTKIWTPVKRRYDNFINAISTGSIKFTEFEMTMGTYNNDYERIRRELAVMYIPQNLIETRVNQLEQHRQLETCVKAANAILKLQNEFELSGDFEQIRTIAAHSENEMEMGSFDDSLMEACGVLHALTNDRTECLVALVKCKTLIDWLKESMKKGGLKELKVFVDLAFLSAGDEPLNIAKVQSLHSAVTGYAPLIFDLVPDCGYKQLLQHCSSVWKELDANPNLPSMLVDTSHQLEWMKQIKKAHGSVEVTSLMQAECINDTGIYTIGKDARRHTTQSQHDDTHVNLADIMELSVIEQLDTAQHRRIYTFSQLQDLQSRLMLVAGQSEKGSDNVDRFTMIFDGLTRLGNVYLKLCSSGCVLFKDWTAEVYCDSTRVMCINLAFGQDDSGQHMSGRRSATEDVTHMVPMIARFMENCLEEWLKYIKEKRKIYLHLNYFTIDQLVILQRELVKVGTETDPSHLIYPLLSAVKLDCVPDDLIEAMIAAKEEIVRLKKESEQDRTMDTGVVSRETAENVELETKRQKFIQQLVDADCDVTLATEASKHVDIDDIKQGMYWCAEHDDLTDTSSQDDVNVDKKEEQSAKISFTGWSQSQTNIQSLIAQNIRRFQKQSETGVKPLIDDLTELWKQFLECLSTNMRDYLSLEHLGLILRYLSDKDTRKLNRALSPVFKEGEPNLIICPNADVLMTTLSIYVNDSVQPLPQSDEILMCTSSTTKDEVDIFWRRAIFDGSRKIHCLINADLLDYDVSESAQQCLEEYMQDVYHTELKSYRLLVICSSDNEYSSAIISSLDKYKRPLLPCNIDVIRQYLVDKFHVQECLPNKVKPAATVDHERSTVRIIKSWRAGVGKSLFKNRRVDELAGLNQSVRSDAVSIPLQEKNLDIHYVIERLLKHSTQPGETATRVFHIDVSHEVQHGIDYLLFNLLILGCLVDKTGWVWRKSTMDLYLIETMPLMMQAVNRQGGDLQYVHQMLNMLPYLTCRSPVESLNIYQNKSPAGYRQFDQLFDEQLFRSPAFQRPFQYLYRLDQGKQLTNINPDVPEKNPQNCLKILLSHCGLKDPSWSELHHFVWFLNTQLTDFEQNNFVSAAAAEDLPGFSTFVLKFLIQMSRDFSTRSLDMTEESPDVGSEDDEQRRDGDAQKTDKTVDDLQPYELRRTWESSPHPYLFFTMDRFSFTFLGFNIEKSSGNLIDQQTGVVLERGIMAKNLYDALVRNHAPLKENFDALQRDKKIMKLCNVMGIDMPHDPDESYELTTDNVKKILAIYMRFRCDIPVIIMGETGCGKTRLIKFMCALQIPPGNEANNVILMKVHGGTTHADIERKVREAEEVATRNTEQLGKHMHTVLFFDEANTTEAIGLIKEVMCDKSIGGKKLELCKNLKIVAACNPYRKHSEELIQKLEKAGLGYHVDVKDTTDRLGRVPMRRLVYRVQPLPHSMLPLVWDFGQLNTKVEELYIRQIVRRYIREDMIPDKYGLVEVASAVLTASQDYMRSQKDECSFVSLRDVDRVLTVMSWFYQQSVRNETLYQLMDDKLYHDDDEGVPDADVAANDDVDEEEDDTTFLLDSRQHNNRVDNVTRSLVLALGVCYHACLTTRQEYRSHIARYFRVPCHLPGGAEQMKNEIESCQEVYLDHVHLEKNIARNMALKENVFMMVVCIELRIPLFLVGKPGSSKSLSKTIVSDAMQGNAARNELFRQLKQAQMVSFQCSPLSTPNGIVGTFKQCAQFQKDKDLNTFVSIVVLDEVGLAEDSPRMPLKTLHPLLEDGCQGDDKPEKHKKVAVIGISNWALDPAKMNRGILVQRDVPDLEELQNSAIGICQTDDKNISDCLSPLIKPMADSYLEIFKNASEKMREFYGLRDFYSLVKMVYSFVEKSKRHPTWFEMLHSIKRNFGGLDQVNSVECFKKHLTIYNDSEPKRGDPDCSSAGLIQACLFDSNDMKSESRYLLLLTENYGALGIIQQQILSRRGDIRPITIFGSNFRSDQEYTQVCRNINKIKGCMETGKTVVLLNLENLYESLYDALNQYYVYFGGERYVDLGLGTHRVKCPVNKTFRLIVVAEKETVYEKFPIPLINRLEKHFLTINTMLSEKQLAVVDKLEDWVKDFVTQKRTGRSGKKPLETTVGEVFIGYHDDTCSAIVLDVWENCKDVTDMEDELGYNLKKAKSVILWSATPESLVRLENSNLSSDERQFLNNIYYNQQAHDSLTQYLHGRIVLENTQQALFAQVTTHSKLLSIVHKGEISKATDIDIERIMLLVTLSSFDTEQQFTNRIIHHIKSSDNESSLIIIQCDSGDVNANLLACARYCIMDVFEEFREEIRVPIHVVFIVQLPRGSSFTGFQCGVWHSVHIDDLHSDDTMPTLQHMQGRSVAGLFSSAAKGPAPMDIEETPCDNITEATENGNGTGVPLGATRKGDELLQLDDVNVFVDEPHGQPYEHATQTPNMKGVILNCIQAALCMVKDKVENTEKKETDRVEMVLTLLHREQVGDQAYFLQGICSLIANLLTEKESRAPHMSQFWLTNEAAALENINKAGTFRRSCLQTLEKKIVLMLAGIISCLDTNDNLKILLDDQCSWKQRLWLEFLNTPNAIKLQYTDLKSPTGESELKEVVVMTTGCEGHSFAARFPFSWLLIPELFEILKVSRVADEVKQVFTKVENAVRVLGGHPVGDAINRCTDPSILGEAVEEYIQDFVHTMYNAVAEHEQQLVCQSILVKAEQIIQESTDTLTVLHHLVFIHLAYESIASRLTYFRAMNNVWPECSESIINLKQHKPDHVMFKEEDFTVSALYLLLENLAPKRDDLKDYHGRTTWLHKIHIYRPVIEKVFSIHSGDPTRCDRARALWSRVLVVKLYFEHGCASDKDEKIVRKQRSLLWNALGEATNFKEMESLTELENFLKFCNKQSRKQYLGNEVKCCSCERTLEGPPISLPCKGVLCEKCYRDMYTRGTFKCGKCHKIVQQDWTPIKQDNNKEALEKLEKFKIHQKKCNAFFMDVVSQLCFADNIAPSDEVVEQLLGYIFFTSQKQQQRTRGLTVFDTGIDPNPVFRSFLLQLLLKTSENYVQEHLGNYLRRAEDFFKEKDMEDQAGHLIELSLLVIQCIEDKLVQDASRVDIEQNHEAHCALDALTRAKHGINMDELNVEKLYALARTRMGLSVAMKYVAIIIQDNENRVDTNMRKIIEAAWKLSDVSGIIWIRIFAVKYLCRCYGIEMYQMVCNYSADYILWLADNDGNRDEVMEVSDRYIVSGDSYTKIRESLTKVLLGGKIENLQEILQELDGQGASAETMLQLALHREITCLNVKQHKRLTPLVKQTLDTLVENFDIIKNKDFAQALVQNEFQLAQLISAPRQDLRTQGVQCLVIHFQSVISHLRGERTLLKPLLSIMMNTQDCTHFYLPTMPQDELDDIRDALNDGRKGQIDESIPLFYRCPNGHPYEIGDCGRPWVEAKCRCGADIGGSMHKLLATNTGDTGQGPEMTGHILGCVDVRERRPNPEREMSPAQCTSIRLIVHLFMYLGCRTNLHGIHSMIKPDIKPDEVTEFIWKHILQDIDDIHESLSRSVDDVLLTMHVIIDYIMTSHTQGENVADNVDLLTRPARRNWEVHFSAKYVQPVLQDLDNILKNNNQQLAQDTRLGATCNNLMRMLYETATKSEAEDLSMLQHIPRVWRYRTPITIQHLRQEVDAKISGAKGNQNQYKVLQLFLKEEHHLRALRFIPSILRLHRALFNKYQRKLDKAEASQITVLQLKKDDVADGETVQLIQDFADAWELVRNHLLIHNTCPTRLGGMPVQKEYCTQSIKDTTPIAMLLPTIKEAGLCSYALLDFLLRKQNAFLDEYLEAANRKSNSISLVSPKEVTTAHLISYDPEHDILPLVLANCQYSFEMGKGTKIEYDFAGLERQLVDRFVFSKSRIDVGSALQIDEMIYRTEFTNALVFQNLGEKIPQSTLSAAVKTQITEDFKSSLPDVCRSQDNLDITIGFLKSTGGPVKKNLHTYMVQTLHMSETCIGSQRAKQLCEFRHCKSLWLLLSFLKVKIMVDRHQQTEATFESVGKEFHEEIPLEVKTQFKEYLEHLSVEKLSQLIEVLHEFILLKVAVRENSDNVDYMSTTNNKLQDYMYAYIDDMDIVPLDRNILVDFPADLLYRHSVDTWIAAYNTLCRKQTGNRRR